jgi:xanthine dehydrogenase YagS FAD-binding subunit
VLIGAGPSTEVFREAAEAAVVDPFTVPGTAFMVELAKRTIVRTLQMVAA